MPTTMSGINLSTCLLFLSFGSIFSVDWDVVTDLDTYVQGDDGHFSWQEIASYNYEGVTLYIVNMTSQMYQTDAYSTRPIWFHIMGIAIPDNYAYPDTAVLIITGGDNEDTVVPDRNDFLGLATVAFANDTGIIAGYIAQVPNQPTYFYDDPEFRRRTEDNIIAWTWRSFLNSAEPSDPTVIERMPMTKAAKRGLDTISEIAAIRAPGPTVDKFIVMGASKRGWTVWSLAATDRRVIAQIPLVFSMINIGAATIQQHNQNMDGGWSFVFEPYYAVNLTSELYNPKTERVWEVEDMYYYRERFTIPLLAMSSTGDEFFLLDDNHNWWNGIPGPKWLMMLPNAEHTMAPHYPQIYATGVSFILHVLENSTIPSVTWTMGSTDDGNGGYIDFVTDPPPTIVNAYWAVTLENDTRRDFRLASGDGENVAIHPVLWRQNLTITETNVGEYHVEVENTPGEWTGFFIEGEWEGPDGKRMVFTSQVNVVPNTFPRPPCPNNDACYGYLV